MAAEPPLVTLPLLKILEIACMPLPAIVVAVYAPPMLVQPPVHPSKWTFVPGVTQRNTSSNTRH